MLAVGSKWLWSLTCNSRGLPSSGNSNVWCHWGCKVLYITCKEFRMDRKILLNIHIFQYRPEIAISFSYSLCSSSICSNGFRISFNNSKKVYTWWYSLFATIASAWDKKPSANNRSVKRKRQKALSLNSNLSSSLQIAILYPHIRITGSSEIRSNKVFCLDESKFNPTIGRTTIWTLKTPKSEGKWHHNQAWTCKCDSFPFTLGCSFL